MNKIEVIDYLIEKILHFHEHNVDLNKEISELENVISKFRLSVDSAIDVLYKHDNISNVKKAIRILEDI